jgi:hypothetical protein
LVLDDPSTLDCGRYIITDIAQEFLTVVQEDDLVTTTFFSVTSLALNFRIDDCRRNELNDPDSIIGKWGLALGGLDDVYKDTSSIDEIGYSLLNHIANGDQFIYALVDVATPIVEDPSATLTNATTVTGLVDFAAGGALPGDILFVNTADVNRSFYLIDTVVGSVLTIDPTAGPTFYTTHSVVAKRPEFSATPSGPVFAGVFRNTGDGFVSGFSLLTMLQEKIQSAEVSSRIDGLTPQAVHQPVVDVTYGDPENSALSFHVGPDLTTQYIANLTDRLDRVRDYAGNVLYEDLYAILYAVDQLFDQRYGWIAQRTHTVTGTLPRLRRFDDTREDREQDLLDTLLLSGGGA